MKNPGNVGRALAVGILSVAVALLLTPVASFAQVTISATSGDAYAQLEGKGMGLELPDCGHPVKHIRTVMDSTLNKYVFAFDIHRDLDDDRCNGSTDRQRLEIKTNSGSAMQLTNGQTGYYRWKFKLDAGFKPSSSFYHIFQIKAHTGGDEGSPLITITPRKGTPDHLQIIFTAPSGGSGSGTKAEVDLTPFKGTWVEAFVQYKSADSGNCTVQIKRLSDGATLLNWTSGTLDMWRSGNDFNRGKWGQYRSLNDKSSLRDETALFADWCISETSASECPSAAGGGGSPTPTPTPTPIPSATATPTPTPIPNATATPTPTPVPGATPTPTPVPGGVSFEAESVTVTNSGTGTTVQTDATCSGGKWVSLDAENTGSWFEFTTPSIPAGTYTLKMSYKTNNNRGQLTMKVDGTQVGGTLEQYAALPSAYPTYTFGTVTFGTTGTHKLRMAVVGKSSSSTSYVLSADKFILQ